MSLTALTSRIVVVAGTFKHRKMPFGRKHFSSTSGGSFFQVSIENDEPANGAIFQSISAMGKALAIIVDFCFFFN